MCRDVSPLCSVDNIAWMAVLSLYTESTRVGHHRLWRCIKATHQMQASSQEVAAGLFHGASHLISARDMGPVCQRKKDSIGTLPLTRFASVGWDSKRRGLFI